MRCHRVLGLFILALSLLIGACSMSQSRRSTGVLDYLYPDGAEAAPPQTVHLALPVRVGLAFVPEGERHYSGDAFTMTRRHDLLQRIAGAFREEPFIQSVEVLPATYMKHGGGYDNLDQLRSAFGVDLVVLVSYDQTQLTESNRWSVTYWTVVGAYFVEGEENDTHTLLDAVVVDIPSRALLFRAAGTSRVAGSATAATHGSELQANSEEGFDLAMDDLIDQLRQSLDAFAAQAASGTVRGMGTPSLTVTDPQGVGSGGYGGAGSLGIVETLLAALILGWLVLDRSRSGAG